MTVREIWGTESPEEVPDSSQGVIKEGFQKEEMCALKGTTEQRAEGKPGLSVSQVLGCCRKQEVEFRRRGAHTHSGLRVPGSHGGFYAQEVLHQVGALVRRTDREGEGDGCWELRAAKAGELRAGEEVGQAQGAGSGGEV